MIVKDLEKSLNYATEQVHWLAEQIKESKKIGNKQLIEITEKTHEIAYFNTIIMRAILSACSNDGVNTLYKTFQLVDEAELGFGMNSSIAKNIREVIWRMMLSIRQQDANKFIGTLNETIHLMKDLNAKLTQLINVEAKL